MGEFLEGVSYCVISSVNVFFVGDADRCWVNVSVAVSVDVQRSVKEIVMFSVLDFVRERCDMVTVPVTPMVPVYSLEVLFRSRVAVKVTVFDAQL